MRTNIKIKWLVVLFCTIFSLSAFSKSYQGTLRVLIFDSFERNQSTMQYQLEDGNIQYILDLPSSVDKSKLLDGMRITVEGEILKAASSEFQKIKVDSLSIQSLLNPNALSSNKAKTLALLVDFTDKKASKTLSINDINTILYTADNSVKVNFEHSSFNQASLNPDANGDGTSDIYPIQLNYEIGTTCNYGQWANDAKSAAIQLGINPANYDFISYVLPTDIGCEWGGLASLGCGNTPCNSWVRSYPISRIYSKIVFAHELGHLFGSHHSAIDANNDGQAENQYGDKTCFMGVGGFAYWKELNAPHRDQLRWLASSPESIKTITESGRYVLSPLESGTGNKKLLILKFYKADTNQYYYLSYRTNQGPFGSGITDAMNKLSIHKAEDSRSALTYFIQALDVNQTFVDDVNKINIKVLSLNESGVEVQVNLGIQNPVVKSYKFYQGDNTISIGYTDWDVGYWKGNCGPYAETVGLSTQTTTGRPNSIACLIQNSSTSKASGQFARTLGKATSSHQVIYRNGDWDQNYYKWECGLNEYVSGFSQNTQKYTLHKIRCAKGEFTNGGKNACETRFVSNGKDDRGSTQGGDWDVGYYKSQCSDGKLIFGVSVSPTTLMPHKILCCNK